ncbi:MAG: large subunit ribosomal protein L17 [Candidatus Midichloriaceae bacterium]|jgi:large subunit ribosomal protein L17
MHHRKSYRTLSRSTAHRKSLLRNLCISLINNGQIKTTLPKAKELRPIIEKMVTAGKANSLHARRRLISKLGGAESATNKIMTEISPKFADRNGGYTRILKYGYRKGDCAPMAIIQFVE